MNASPAPEPTPAWRRWAPRAAVGGSLVVCAVFVLLVLLALG